MRAWIAKALHLLPHRAALVGPYAHLAYFGAVFWEAHSFYGTIAGGLLLLGLVALLGGEAE